MSANQDKLQPKTVAVRIFNFAWGKQNPNLCYLSLFFSQKEPTSIAGKEAPGYVLHVLFGRVGFPAAAFLSALVGLDAVVSAILTLDLLHSASWLWLTWIGRKMKKEPNITFHRKPVLMPTWVRMPLKVRPTPQTFHRVSVFWNRIVLLTFLSSNLWIMRQHFGWGTKTLTIEC